MTPTTEPPPPRRRLAIKGFEGYPAWPVVILFCVVAVDFMDMQAFNVLLPNIRDEFHLSTAGVLSIVAAVGPVVTITGLIVGYAADRFRRTPLASGGVAVWGASVFLSSVAPRIELFGIAPAGTGLGLLVNQPAH